MVGSDRTITLDTASKASGPFIAIAKGGGRDDTQPTHNACNNIGKITVHQLTLEECAGFWEKLLTSAYEDSAFDVVCTLLRVTSYENPQWDPFEESRVAFLDFSWMLEESKLKREENCQLRIALLMYCQAIEMNWLQETLANLLRIIAGKRYHMDPFLSLYKKTRPPSATSKFKEILRQAEEAKRDDVHPMIELVLNDQVRNAFSHSDYILTENAFRWTKGDDPFEIKKADLLTLINNCFMFTGSLFETHQRWCHGLGRAKKYHKRPRYEVLELLASEDIGLFGFRVHFSNGCSAEYIRRPGEGSKPLNVRPDQDGGFGLFIGDADSLERVWKIDGKPILDWEALNNPAAIVRL